MNHSSWNNPLTGLSGTHEDSWHNTPIESKSMGHWTHHHIHQPIAPPLPPVVNWEMPTGATTDDGFHDSTGVWVWNATSTHPDAPHNAGTGDDGTCPELVTGAMSDEHNNYDAQDAESERVENEDHGAINPTIPAPATSEGQASIDFYNAATPGANAATPGAYPDTTGATTDTTGATTDTTGATTDTTGATTDTTGAITVGLGDATVETAPF